MLQVDFSRFPSFCLVLSLVGWACFGDLICSTSSPGGNLVDGLPPITNIPQQVWLAGALSRINLWWTNLCLACSWYCWWISLARCMRSYNHRYWMFTDALACTNRNSKAHFISRCVHHCDLAQTNAIFHVLAHFSFLSRLSCPELLLLLMISAALQVPWR